MNAVSYAISGYNRYHHCAVDKSLREVEIKKPVHLIIIIRECKIIIRKCEITDHSYSIFDSRIGDYDVLAVYKRIDF